MASLPRYDVLNLDTHILIYAAEQQLTRTEHRLLDDDLWCVSSIVLWEIEQLARLGRLASDLRSPHLLQLLDQIRIIPIDINIARCVRLLDFRSDPADEIISATSIQLDVPLVTRDERLLASKVVPLVRT
jgi:PIN domain nuclease of toxin-antitoxin system